MTRKAFHFDFNEDADPVEELHRLRVARTRHFKTIDALVAHDRAHPVPTAREMIAELEAEIAEKKARKKLVSGASGKSKTDKTSPRQRKLLKRLVHA